MKVLLKISCFILFFLLTQIVQAQPSVQEECGTETSQGKMWTYCFFQTEGSQNPDTIIYFHGRSDSESGNEKLWTKPNFFPAALRNHWQVAGLQAPRIFAVSFGSTWVLTDRNENKMNVPYAMFEADVLTQAKKMSGEFPGRVLVLGDSMGGLNASIFALRTGQRVDKLALLCPLIAKLSPFASMGDVGKFLSANPEAKAGSVTLVMGLGRISYLNEKDWQENFPLEIMKRRQEKLPFDLYVSAGTQDNFGIFSGAEAFVKEAQRPGTRTEFIVKDEDHCAIDPKTLADFLAKF